MVEVAYGFDPVRLEILWGGLLSVVEEMSITLKRTAYSELIREANDFSCAVFDAEGNMLAQTDWVGSPGHLGSVPKIMKSLFEEYPPETLEPGDVIATNNPWLGSGHLPDLVMISPIFHEGKLVAFALNIAHHSDIGGRAPGGHIADSRIIFEEGILIPMHKLYKAGKPNEDTLKMITANVRMSKTLLNDIKAQLAANFVAERRLKEFMKDAKLEDLTDLAKAIITITEEATRKALESVPKGTYTWEHVFDGPQPGTTLKMKVTIEAKGPQMKVDWTGTSPQTDSGLNSPFNYTYAYTIHAIKGALTPELPFNEGALRPIEVYAPEGTIVNANFPAAVGARHVLSWHVNATVCGALSLAIPDRVLAASGGESNMPQFSGINPRTGRPFIHVAMHSGGLGARPNKDGIHAFAFPPRAENTPVEVTETANPLRIERLEILQDSGGAGKYRGGCGLIVDFRILTDKPCTIVNVVDWIEFGPPGLFGGLPGSKSEFILNPDTPNEQRLDPRKIAVVPPGSLVRCLVPGGGGYGDPLERDPQLVLEDVRNGFVSLEKAKEFYGVVIDPKTMSLDLKATDELRKKLKASRT
ncbi:MAG: hydantoinase B/oxoprolinase family protein [Thermoprotei archaeon]|nr:MAG: hydantoinase B/oxoprolinase family protein [Thermoprotei archaeon]